MPCLFLEYPLSGAGYWITGDIPDAENCECLRCLRANGSTYRKYKIRYVVNFVFSRYKAKEDSIDRWKTLTSIEITLYSQVYMLAVRF